MAPEAAVARIREAIGRRPKRVLGVLKVEREYAGIVGGQHFEVWERRAHAIRAVGQIRGQRGGSRIETAFALSRRARALLVVLFAAYAIAVVGIVQLPAERPAPVPPVVVAVAGALVLAGGFLINALRQRSDLRRFISDLFADVLADAPSGGPARGRHLP
jgi:hypothetical protein